MRKRPLILIVVSAAVGFAGLLLIGIGHGQSSRKARLDIARGVLRDAYVKNERNGILPLRNGSWAIWPCSISHTPH